MHAKDIWHTQRSAISEIKISWIQHLVIHGGLDVKPQLLIENNEIKAKCLSVLEDDGSCFHEGKKCW